MPHGPDDYLALRRRKKLYECRLFYYRFPCANYGTRAKPPILYYLCAPLPFNGVSLALFLNTGMSGRAHAPIGFSTLLTSRY